jgi:hypothetical protein
MNKNIIKKPCPVCKTLVGTTLFSQREEIKRCTQCGALLIENPKRALLGMIIGLAGLILGLCCPELLGISFFWGLSIILGSFFVSGMINNFTIIKKDLIIRNKLTGEISFTNKSDWDEILKNSTGGTINFEIVEELK